MPSDPKNGGTESRVPSRRLNRFLQLGTTAGRMALGGATEAVRRAVQKAEQELPHALLTAQNARLLAERLSRLRGAAMKVGQMLSMEGDNLLPKEFAEALEVLRSSAHRMPEAQVEEVLVREFGERWREDFGDFSLSPLAAASIGQVHAATTITGERIVLKLQYPGVAESIESDVDNLRSLLALTRLVPSSVDLDAFVEEVKEELRREVDYGRELEQLRAYRAVLGEREDVRLPRPFPELSTDRVLALERVDGEPLLTWSKSASQERRDRVGALLFELLLREFFEYGLMQTDPNPANYFHDGERLVLLDFGATREVSPQTRDLYLRSFVSLLRRDRDLLRTVLRDLNVPVLEMPEATELLLDLSLEVAEALDGGVYDFGTTDLSQRIQAKARVVSRQQKDVPPPPPEYLFFQRKLGGTFLLLRQLRARVDCRAILEGLLENLDESERRRLALAEFATTASVA